MTDKDISHDAPGVKRFWTIKPLSSNDGYEGEI